MTKEITKAFILQQMENKFGLREFDLSKFLFSETVQPVYNIEQEVENTFADYTELPITSAAGYTFFTVPATERWWLQRYVVVFVGVNTVTIAGVYIIRKKQLIADCNIYLDLTAAQTVSYINDLPKAARLDPGDSLRIFADGYTSDQDVRLYIDYIKEEIR